MAKTQLNSKGIKNSSILNEDIADNAAISQSKIDGLVDILGSFGTAINQREMKLPSQTGNSGKVLTTDGTNISWGVISGGSNNNAIVYNFTEQLLQTNWNYVNNLYQYIITNVNFKNNSYVEVIPDNNSINDILYSEFYPKVQINDSNIIIYAKRIPENTITVFINVITKAPNPFDVVLRSNDLNIDGLLGTFFVINITTNASYIFDLENITTGIFYYVLIKNNSTGPITITLPNVNTIRSCDSITILNNKAKELSFIWDGTDYIFQVSEELYK
jgi:hypothetical protein